jgi:hypothetical protein
MKKHQLNISLNPTAFADFEKVAESEHMTPNDLARLLIHKWSDIKQGFGLSALTSIPKDHFKLRPGRPASGSIVATGDFADTTS